MAAAAAKTTRLERMPRSIGMLHPDRAFAPPVGSGLADAEHCMRTVKPTVVTAGARG